MIFFVQYEETKTELSDLTEKYEKTEQETQSLTDELESCKANMKELQEKGSKVSDYLTLNRKEKAVFISLKKKNNTFFDKQHMKSCRNM